MTRGLGSCPSINTETYAKIGIITQWDQKIEVSMNLSISMNCNLRKRIKLEGWIYFRTKYVKGGPLMKSYLFGDEKPEEYFWVACLRKMKPSSALGKGNLFFHLLKPSIGCYSKWCELSIILTPIVALENPKKT